MKKIMIIAAMFATALFVNAQDPQKTLKDAIMSGMLDNVKTAVETLHADVNKQFKDKAFDNFPLHDACFMYNPEIAVYLIEKGANVNSLNRFGATPLSMLCQTTIQDEAITEKMITIINALIAKQADLNILSKGGYSALGYATEHNNTKVALLLLEKGADPNVRGGGKFTFTPLMYACKAGNFELVKALLAKGAKINEIRETVQGNIVTTENAASMASDGNFAEILQYLKDNGAKAPKGRKIWK